MSFDGPYPHNNIQFLMCHYLVGGVVLVALDFRGMREYVRINPRAKTLDALYEFLVESEIIPTEVTERCNIEFSLKDRNLEIALSARTSEDEEFCGEVSNTVAEVIDDPQQLSSFYPDSLQFATAAVAGAPVEETASHTPNLIMNTYLVICAVALSALGALI